MHCALNVANNPELSSYCLEGNVLHGGLDTSKVKGSSTESAVKSSKRKERQSNTKHQEDVLNYMKERNLGDSRSSKVTMLKDLTIALSVLYTTWIEMDNRREPKSQSGGSNNSNSSSSSSSKLSVNKTRT